MSSLVVSWGRKAIALLTALPAFAAEPLVAGKLGAPPKNEASGLTASGSSDLLWTHDDSGGKPSLYAVSLTGKLRTELQLGAVQNTDWEDLAVAELDGKTWLVIGDIGDNDAKRSTVLLHFVAEPDSTQLSNGTVRVAKPDATLRVRYEDGPRDCESLGIDAKERAIYLLTKRDAVPRLYRVELPAGPLGDAELRARFIGLVPHVHEGGKPASGFKGTIDKVRSRPCAMDFARDGSAAVVLTYGEVLLFPRRASEPWAATLGRAPLRLGDHGLPQAEGVCFSRDGQSIYVVSESSRKLLKYARPIAGK